MNEGKENYKLDMTATEVQNRINKRATNFRRKLIERFEILKKEREVI